MGINPKSLPQAARAQLAKVRRAPVAARVRLFVAGDPPTATHQAKELRTSFGKGGVRRASIGDKPELVAAVQQYLAAIPENRRAPLAPPVSAYVEFRWAMGGTADPTQPAEWRVQKPDLDNATKTLADVLAERGWIQDDKHLALMHLSKLDVCADVDPPGVLVQLETMLHPPEVTPRDMLPLRPGYMELVPVDPNDRPPKVKPEQERSIPREPQLPNVDPQGAPACQPVDGSPGAETEAARRRRRRLERASRGTVDRAGH